ncbi:TPR-like protein [Xylona heveae TC161]|uniref:TPR-like protein n=1 Tax=Xylona heveae (strain CBS 132557 / TC161) TaxID=1328760 RepID=A0A165G3B6_XYLHT|nr:TPR-like protein [Xylona heveae TC161]KZF21690.1 TPR-like protein [Xylona heveae TC161]
MPPTNPFVVNQLRHLIYYNLDNNLFRNALFLAGRLHAYEPRSSEAAYLVALCYLGLGQLKAAFDYSRSPGARGTHLGCSYIFAQACLGLERYAEGIAALERSRGLWSGRNHWNKHSETTRRPLPDAAAVYCLLGKLWHAHHNVEKAVEYYVEALKLNPFMWDAFLGLCDTGANIRTPNIFKMTPEMLAILSASSHDEPRSLGTLEESPPPSNVGPLQSQQNNGNSAPMAYDPFSAPTNGISGDEKVGFGSSSLASNLFRKMNGEAPVHVGMAPSVGGGGGISFEGLETPPNNSSAVDAAYMAAAPPMEPPHAPLRRTRTLQGLGYDLGADIPPRLRKTTKSRTRLAGDADDSDHQVTTRSSSTASAAGERKRTVTGQANLSSHLADPTAAPQRRSVRLFNQIRPTSTKATTASNAGIGLRESRDLRRAKATGAKGRSATASSLGRAVSGNRKPIEGIDLDGKEARIASSSSSARHASIEAAKEQEALQWLLDVFSKLGAAYFALTRYQCQEALQIFCTLPQAQRETPWVLAQMGRAYYEQANYVEAEKYFKRIKLISPSRMEDMEVYSTILWHLKNDVELAFLSHELLDMDRLSPQAWCALGNSFSLQREHDQALKCFKRATQLDPKFAYAFTLQGHEHVANEEYDKALTSYRQGISADSRHYNAWYGLGKVYEKMGKYEVAEKHFRTAAEINPTNAVLICCIGVVLEKMKNPKAALIQYSRACDLAPRSALSRFKKARVLMTLQENHMALAELRLLKDLAPDEANVHFLLGRLYKMLHQKANAIKHFTTALNLDPKAAQYIKDAMESLEDEEDEEEEDEDDMS